MTVRGKDAVVVLSVEDYARLNPAGSPKTLFEIFGVGPFTELTDFEEATIRVRTPMRALPDFNEDDGDDDHRTPSPTQD